MPNSAAMRVSVTLVLYLVVACSNDSDGTTDASAGAGGVLSLGGGGQGSTDTSNAQGGTPSTGSGGLVHDSAIGGASNLGGTVGSTTGGTATAGGSSGQFVDCDTSKVTCKMAAPNCGTDRYPVVDAPNRCYEGSCVTIDACGCTTASDCPATTTNDVMCLTSARHCSPRLL